ncbi:hypothetical protein DERP_006627 [Dermatophagoides pteronyssinus]|uniref:Uncharacterized protein n=1 Tax=Dermatophagoides pteronyssinus TaxID=6956 RepID=A0ABQ8IQW9_DERPT|nr:hypothetical protein DERP_006627 [Dermatophagoides pteronyssinus]
MLISSSSSLSSTKKQKQQKLIRMVHGTIVLTIDYFVQHDSIRIRNRILPVSGFGVILIVMVIMINEFLEAISARKN